MNRRTIIGQSFICIIISLLSGYCHAQFAPETNEMQHVQDIHFPDGNEFVASINDTVVFQIEMDFFIASKYPPKYVPSLCKDGMCFGQGSTINNSQTFPTLTINVNLEVKSDQSFGTWGLHIADHVAWADSFPMLAHIYINNAAVVENAGNDDILWCHESETYNYVKLDEPPKCPPLSSEMAPTEIGTLTVYVDNYMVQSQPAWTCKVIINRIRLKCVHLQQTEEPQRESIESVSVEECQQWYTNKTCKHGTMEKFGDDGSSWMTDNGLKVNYNHWFRVCVKGKHQDYTSYNCLMNEVPITYQAPFTELFSAATGSLPLSTLATHGTMRAFKTIAWSAESSDNFMHVCRKVISLTLRVTKTTYQDLKAASQHKALHGAHTPTNDTVYQFMAVDKSAVMYVVEEKDRTTLKAIEAGSCGDEYTDTFTSNSLVLQYVADSYLVMIGKARYTGANHHPTFSGFHQHPLYVKADEHTNAQRSSVASSALMCGVVNMKSDTHECQNGTAVSKRRKREVNPEVPDIIQARLDYLEAKQKKKSEEWVRQLAHQTCLQQRRVHFLQTMQLDIEPSDTFSSYAKRRVHVVPRGDIHALQHCVRISCTKLHVIPSLKTTHAPMQSLYENKGVFISENMVFSRPIVQFNQSGDTVTAQLQHKYYLNPYLTHITRHEKKEQRESKENGVPYVQFFQVCDQYYIFEENEFVSTVEVGEAGTEQHLVREFKNGLPEYRLEVAGADNQNGISGSSISMLIKSFATFTTAHLTVPEASFYGLRKSSYYTQEAVLSQVHTLQDAIAITARLQENALFNEAQYGREEIHATVNTMSEVTTALRDGAIMSGNTIGGFIGSTVGSATGMTVKSFTDIASDGITHLMDSIFSKVMNIIGNVGGIWAIIVTIAVVVAYRRKLNLFDEFFGRKQNKETDEEMESKRWLHDFNKKENFQ